MTTKTKRYKDFGDTPAPANIEPVTFKLNGEDFTCVPEIPGAFLLDFVRRADSGDGGKSAAAIFDLFEKTLEPESYERFYAMAMSSEKIVNIEKLTDVIGWLTEQYADRPTQPPKPSSPGRPRGGRTSTAAAS